MKYAFFLGAGASKSCGAPLQGDLFKEYFKIRQEKNKQHVGCDAEHDMEREIATIFEFMFGIDVNNGDLTEVNFPTFEEVLGVIDLAVIRKQAFKNFEGAHYNLNSDNRLEKCRQYLTYLMGSLLYDKLHDVYNLHKDLTKKLKDIEKLSDCMFLSTNYDILIDNALSDMAFCPRPNYSPYYGFKFTNYKPEKEISRVPLYKLHGSLNWLYCPTCETMSLTMNEKGVIKLIRPTENTQDIQCTQCGSLKESVIIPPTYFKEYSNYFLNQVWHKAEQDLRKVEKIFFCGYSFPDADIQIKYLLKRIETNRNGQPLQVYVANGYPEKKSDEEDLERKRYNRFFIQEVNYLEDDFYNLITNLQNYL
jgi:NAD-dependent SIR2 family protein deacetylase